MTRTSSKNRNTVCALTITLFSTIAITLVLTSCFWQPSFSEDTDAIINHVPIQSVLPTPIASINETNSSHETNANNNNSTVQGNTVPISSNLTKFNTQMYEPYSLQQPHYAPLKDTPILAMTPEQAPPNPATSINETNSPNPTNANHNSSAPTPTADPIFLDTSEFTTSSYNGYPVQKLNLTQFYFLFPDNTSEEQIAGSDAVTQNSYIIQKLDFDVLFTAPNLNATGFDEMAIFASSNTTTYKGTEFGIRLDLKDGYVYGYIQEQNSTNGEVNFQMLNLTQNDGINHHYTLTILGSKVTLNIDGTDCGILNFPSNNDYSNITYSICIVVHRFTDGWDSDGDTMTAGNFTLNQQ